MDYSSGKHHVIDMVFVICLLFLFVLCAISVIGIGASIYKKNVQQMSENYDHRISCAYITEKVRQADKGGAVFISTLFNKQVLVLQDNIGGVLYDTYIYEYEGYLMELFVRDGMTNFYPQSGQKILQISGFDISEASDTMLSVNIVTKDGNKNDIFIAKRSLKTQ